MILILLFCFTIVAFFFVFHLIESIKTNWRNSDIGEITILSGIATLVVGLFFYAHLVSIPKRHDWED